jgi:hypothetical protein
VYARRGLVTLAVWYGGYGAIGLLLPLASDVNDKPPVKDDRPDRVFP